MDKEKKSIDGFSVSDIYSDGDAVERFFEWRKF